MRRTTPFIVITVLLVALVLDFWPRLSLPSIADPSGGSHPVEVKLGLDLQGGLQVIYQLQPVNGKTPDASALGTTKSILENRVNTTGVAEPVVQTQGTDQIVVELPGATNAQQIRDLLVTTGKLNFVPLPADVYGTQAAPGPQTAVSGQPLPVAEPPLFGGEEISQAYATTDSTTGQLAVGFRLKDNGAKLFATFTSANVNHFFAIVLDDNVVSAPFIQSAITGGQGVISGGSTGFTSAEMNNLVTVLNYGSLPFPLHEVSVNTISATLAGFSLDRMVIAGEIAIALVFLFMLVYYRLTGLVACLALIYYALVVLAIFRAIPVTLTLAGIAGFVLSVGMAVDANILIFERMKEELRFGKTLPSAMEAGFNRAWNSILDSNVSSLITASILYVFGSSTIKGFGLVLIIGVLASMFTAITVTRTMLRFVIHRPWARRPALYGLTDEEFPAARAARPGLRGEVRGRV